MKTLFSQDASRPSSKSPHPQRRFALSQRAVEPRSATILRQAFSIPPKALQEREVSGLYDCGMHGPRTQTQRPCAPPPPISNSSLSSELGSPFGHPRLKGDQDGDRGHPHQGRGPEDSNQEHRAADGGEGGRPQVVEEHRALPQLGRVLRLSHPIPSHIGVGFCRFVRGVWCGRVPAVRFAVSRAAVERVGVPFWEGFSY